MSSRLFTLVSEAMVLFLRILEFFIAVEFVFTILEWTVAISLRNCVQPVLLFAISDASASCSRLATFLKILRFQLLHVNVIA